MRPHLLSLAVNELDTLTRALARTPPRSRGAAFSAVLDQLQRLDRLEPNDGRPRRRRACCEGTAAVRHEL
jgi:hypothetical protein